MRLVQLTARTFRNLEPVTLDTDAATVVLYGDNAQGKTNALEAVYTLATLKPLRGHRLKELVRWKEDEAQVGGRVHHPGDGERALRVRFGRRRREVWVDGESTRALADYFEVLRVIAFTPSDAEIVTESPARRRQWLDRAAFTASPHHLERVRSYRRVLDQKSAALREGGPTDPVLLDALDEQLAHLGAQLAHHRAALLDELSPHIAAEHQRIAGWPVSVSVRYRTAAPGDDVAARREALAQALAEARHKEEERRMCLVGPQRDDVVLGLGGHSARRYGSRGQVRSMVLALKLAELVAARARGDHPVFLLDDLSSELDRDRTQRLVQRLGDLDAQLFVTTTTPEHLGTLDPSDTRRVRVEDGRLDTGSAGSAGSVPDPVAAGVTDGEAGPSEPTAPRHEAPTDGRVGPAPEGRPGS